jgi:hypothetical protein
MTIVEQASYYCGFVCSDAIDSQQQIIDEIMLLSNYNHDFSLEMIHKLTEMLWKAEKEITLTSLTSSPSLSVT